MKNGLPKEERLNSKKIIEQLFAGGAQSFVVSPLRIVYKPIEDSPVPVSILISVSKKCFARAVDRNRVKRQIREAYRKQKHDLWKFAEERNTHLVVSFIYTADKLISSPKLEKKIEALLALLIEKEAV
jgi:ribonuclease P protein component